MQPHFVCSECGFMSRLAGTCQNESCVRQGERLEKCYCEDDQHVLIVKRFSANSGENSPEQEETGKGNYSDATLDLDFPNTEE